MVNWPALSLLVRCGCAVAFDVAVTTAPATTAPCESVTMPRIAPVVEVWANAVGVASDTAARDEPSTVRLRREDCLFIVVKPQSWVLRTMRCFIEIKHPYFYA